MADLEDVKLDGRPLQSLRVADLKAALEERGLPKSGQKNTLVKRLKGALMLENLQRTSHHHIGLQPNSQIGEEMSQNSFIKQYLAKQQELLRQRLEREAREAVEDDDTDKEDHTKDNNSSPCAAPDQDVAPVLVDQHKLFGLSEGKGLAGPASEGEGHMSRDGHVSAPPAPTSAAVASLAVRVGEQRPERVPTSSQVPADSDDDGADEDWDSGARRRNLGEPPRGQLARARSGGSRQHPQHIPPLLSPQLRQPTPPPSPPPELSFPLPDTPKQSPPSPGEPPARQRTSSTSSSGSSSSGSCSSSPDPQSNTERKPGPLTLLARKMASEGAFSGVGWHGRGDAERQDKNAATATMSSGRGPQEGTVSAITHTTNAAASLPFPRLVPVTNQGVLGGHLPHSEVPVSVLRPTIMEERDAAWQQANKEKELQAEREREKSPEQERLGAMEQERLERQRIFEQQRAVEQERERALERERKEREKALARERKEREMALEREKALEQERKERALARERAQALEREEEEREKALAKEREEREKAMQLEKQRAMERERALEQEREKEKALEREREEKAALESEREEKAALERERMVKVLELERQKALEREMREKEREEKVRALEQERIEREKALEKEITMEKEREERERALEQEKVLQREKEKALEQEKALQREKEEKERALEQENVLQREKEERERALEQEKALHREREERERALEQKKASQREKEKRESHLPPWKRSREFGLTPLPTPPLSTGAGKMAATEEGGEPKVPSLPQKALRDNQPAESGTPLSQSLAMSLSPQSSFKKFRFLRDPIVLSQSSASGVIKRPRTFSESHHPQSLALQSPSKFGEPEQEGTQQGSQPSAGQAAPKKPARQGVLVSGADTSGTTGPERETPVISTLGKSPEEEKGKSLVSEEHVQAHREETDKQVVGETAREAKAPSGPAGAVLPPSPQPVEGKVEKGRERSQKKEEKLGRRSSSSNDSSDSGSSSSGSSGSSSSQGKTHTTPSGRRPEKPQTNTISQDTETVSQPEDPTEAPKAPQHKKRVSGEEKEDMNIVGARHRKKPFLGMHAGEDNGQKDSEGEQVKTDTTREVNEAAMAEPKKAPESSEECETPKAFTARRISLSSSKASPGAVSAEGETESGAGRKRRWGSSTAVTAKKSSMSITTDSLKSLIPDIRLCPGQEMVVDLHPEEDHLSGVEEGGRERGEQDLKIRRTVTQVVPSVTQENGQKESKRSEHEEEDREDGGEVKGDREEKMDGSFQRDSLETQCPSPPSHDMEMKTVTPSDTLIRRSISQQKSGVSITIDDPVRTAKQPSPPRGKVSNIVHVSNLVRPFTLGQLKELLGRTGTVLEDGFWIDKIKSHCYVTYSSAEESIATRAALHGVKWPQSNPKFLSLDFIQQEELDFHRGLPPPERAGEGERGAAAVPGRGAALPPLLPEREQWAEREREMEHRERTRAEREWDRDKVRDFGPGKPGEEAVPRRSCSRERKRKERKMDKKEKAADELPVKLLDELFNKTKAAPCIYWLPLTEEQFAQKETARQERMKRRKEQQEEVEKKREEERKERMKAASVASGERGEGERYREREGDWGRDGESGKHREDCYRRPGGSSAGGARRSRSRSDPPPRDRRR
ncbi:apoptotic chromatin condensation inducer in the nucleus-like isoform X4 [Salvelinus namaycush]|uniref:Apoptotic chromatin condensation inducer in the nucleus-like isoform X4 n=1 Tax=Salvelinus namaycush TaxID=8040 RepID=A0A8U1C3T0_SALNM|nr:apoptotic chromatin condensation inducer in the nucleus-like isoform X4 [Salvelinus namaycush]